MPQIVDLKNACHHTRPVALEKLTALPAWQQGAMLRGRCPRCYRGKPPWSGPRPSLAQRYGAGATARAQQTPDVREAALTRARGVIRTVASSAQELEGGCAEVARRLVSMVDQTWWRT